MVVITNHCGGAVDAWSAAVDVVIVISVSVSVAVISVMINVVTHLMADDAAKPRLWQCCLKSSAILTALPLNTNFA